MDIDLDSSVTTKPSHEVLEAMLPFFQKRFGKKELSSLFEEGLNTFYKLAGADSEDHMVFTSSHTESINHIVFSTYWDVVKATGKNHFVASTIDEAPPILSMSRLVEAGALFDMVPVNEEGIVTLDALASTITPRTALLSLSLCNGLTGVLQPISEIASFCKLRNILLHIDASHIVGKTPLSFKELNCDFMTINGEMLHAPTSGLLFIKKEHLIAPLIVGGQEQGLLRGGSYSLPSFFGLVKAAEIALQNQNSLPIELASLRDLFEESLSPFASPFFQTQSRAPHISCLHFRDVHADALLYFLQKKRLFATLGGGNFQKIVHILKASKLPPHSALSFSFSRYFNKEMVERSTKIIQDTYLWLKKEGI